MTYILLYFDVWGFSTHYKDSWCHKKNYQIIFVLHIVLASISTFVIVKFFERPNNDQLGTFTDALKLFGALTVYWVTILELYIRQHSQRQFWHIFRKIDIKFCNHQHLRFNKYIIKMVVYMILFLVMYFNYYIILFHSSGSDLYDFWIVHSLLQMFLRNHLFYYLFFLEFIKHQLQIIQQETKLMIYDNRKKKFDAGSILTMFHRKRLRWIRDYYDAVHDMCNVINEIFGWSNASAIIISFGQILGDTFWFYWKILNKYEIDLIGNHLNQLI